MNSENWAQGGYIATIIQSLLVLGLGLLVIFEQRSKEKKEKSVEKLRKSRTANICIKKSWILHRI